MPKRRKLWDGGDKEILLEFTRVKWSVEPQRGPLWTLWTHSTRTPTAARNEWQDSMSKTTQGAAAAAAGKAAAKARLEARDAELCTGVAQGFSFTQMAATIGLQDGKALTASALSQYWHNSLTCTLSNAQKAAAEAAGKKKKAEEEGS